jgi:hypothetical protein
MTEPIADTEELTQSGLSLIAEADRLMDQWGSNVEMDYARSLAKLGSRNLPFVNRAGNEVAYVVPHPASESN